MTMPIREYVITPSGYGKCGLRLLQRFEAIQHQLPIGETMTQTLRNTRAFLVGCLREQADKLEVERQAMIRIMIDFSDISANEATEVLPAITYVHRATMKLRAVANTVLVGLEAEEKSSNTAHVGSDE